MVRGDYRTEITTVGASRLVGGDAAPAVGGRILTRMRGRQKQHSELCRRHEGPVRWGPGPSCQTSAAQLMSQLSTVTVVPLDARRFVPAATTVTRCTRSARPFSVRCTPQRLRLP